MFIRVGKTGQLGPWSRVIVYCSKLSFFQNDSPIACFIDIASNIFMSIHRFLDKGTPGYLESFQNKCRLSPLQIAVDKSDTNSNVLLHTNQNSFYKWTKISSLEINIFHLKMMVKSGLEFFTLKFTKPLWPSELLLPSANKSAQKGLIGLAGQQVSLKGLGEFQNKKIF